MTDYIVALETGGLMECPTIEYKEGEIINASNPREAEETFPRV